MITLTTPISPSYLAYLVMSFLNELKGDIPYTNPQIRIDLELQPIDKTPRGPNTEVSEFVRARFSRPQPHEQKAPSLWKKANPSETKPIDVKILEYYPLGVWHYKDGSEICGVCRESLFEICHGCQDADSLDNDKVSQCTVAWGVCGHPFHTHCIREWVQTNARCPYCSREWQAESEEVAAFWELQRPSAQSSVEPVSEDEVQPHHRTLEVINISDEDTEMED